MHELQLARHDQAEQKRTSKQREVTLQAKEYEQVR
jgi:hypothetical protein